MKKKFSIMAKIIFFIARHDNTVMLFLRNAPVRPLVVLLRDERTGGVSWTIVFAPRLFKFKGNEN